MFIKTKNLRKCFLFFAMRMKITWVNDQSKDIFLTLPQVMRIILMRNIQKCEPKKTRRQRKNNCALHTDHLRSHRIASSAEHYAQTKKAIESGRRKKKKQIHLVSASVIKQRKSFCLNTNESFRIVNELQRRRKLGAFFPIIHSYTHIHTKRFSFIFIFGWHFSRRISFIKHLFLACAACL